MERPLGKLRQWGTISADRCEYLVQAGTLCYLFQTDARSLDLPQRASCGCHGGKSWGEPAFRTWHELPVFWLLGRLRKQKEAALL